MTTTISGVSATLRLTIRSLLSADFKVGPLLDLFPPMKTEPRQPERNEPPNHDPNRHLWQGYHAVSAPFPEKIDIVPVLYGGNRRG
jgi:hypothetical protein